MRIYNGSFTITADGKYSIRMRTRAATASDKILELTERALSQTPREESHKHSVGIGCRGRARHACPYEGTGEKSDAAGGVWESRARLSAAEVGAFGADGGGWDGGA